MVQVVDRIFTPRSQQISSNGTETKEWIPWNTKTWNTTIQARKRERELRRRKKKKVSTIPIRDGSERKECAGIHSYEGLNEDKTAKVCFCDIGYAFNDNDPNAGCVDINECDNNTNGSSSGLCGNNARCINTDGSFICQCPIGTTGDPSKDCIKVEDENLTTSETTKAIVSTENSIVSTEKRLYQQKILLYQQRILLYQQRIRLYQQRIQLRMK